MQLLKSSVHVPTPDMANGKAILLLHEFKGSAESLKYLAKTFCASGFFVFAPLYEGHGCDTTEDFQKTHWIDWFNSAEIAYLSLLGGLQGLPKFAHKDVSIVGYEMGAHFAIQLDIKYGVDRTVLISPNLKVKNYWRHMTPILRHFIKYDVNPLYKPEETKKGMFVDALDRMIYKSNIWFQKEFEFTKVIKMTKSYLAKHNPSWDNPENRHVCQIVTTPTDRVGLKIMNWLVSNFGGHKYVTRLFYSVDNIPEEAVTAPFEIMDFLRRDFSDL